MWDLRGSGLELLCPALAGGFFTTEPPGQPQQLVLRTTVTGKPGLPLEGR